VTLFRRQRDVDRARFRIDDGVNHRQDQEDDGADDQVAGDDEVAERADHLAGFGGQALSVALGASTFVPGEERLYLFWTDRPD
jgi:hypothetical protein